MLNVGQHFLISKRYVYSSCSDSMGGNILRILRPNPLPARLTPTFTPLHGIIMVMVIQ